MRLLAALSVVATFAAGGCADSDLEPFADDQLHKYPVETVSYNALEPVPSEPRFKVACDRILCEGAWCHDTDDDGYYDSCSKYADYE